MTPTPKQKKLGVKCPKCNLRMKRSERIFHDLRRSGVRNLIRSGVDYKTAMLISGHLTMSVFMRYNIVDEADVMAACRASQKLHTTPKTDELAGAEILASSIE